MGQVKEKMRIMREVSRAVEEMLAREGRRPEGEGPSGGEGAQPHRPRREPPSFSPEPAGARIVNAEARSRLVEELHGRVVNSLAEELGFLGYRVVNRGVARYVRPDLFVIGGEGGLTAIIEVKTGCSWNDVKDILGQLLLYRFLTDAPEGTVLVAAVPANIGERAVEFLAHHGIGVMRWRRRRGAMTFGDLDALFPRLPSAPGRLKGSNGGGGRKDA